MSQFKHRIFLACASFVLIGVLVAWSVERGRTARRHSELSLQEYEPPPPGMVLVPAGEFLMGSADPAAEPDEKPLRRVFLPAFYIDRFEVTNRRYREFKKDHRFPPGEDDLPVTFVLKREAEAFCHWAGRRLPTDAEWEKAARGTAGRIYPWGDAYVPGLANINKGGGMMATNGRLCRAPSMAGSSPGKRLGGSFPGGVSPYGCQDMAGNVWEWVADTWVDPGGVPGRRKDEDGRGILRGGAYGYSPWQARTSYHGFEALEATCHDVGFRCAQDARVARRSR